MNANIRTTKCNFAVFKSGNNITFNATHVYDLQTKLIIDIIQSGSGDPSPSNIRPILGSNDIIIYHIGDYPHSENFTVSFDDDVYIASVDLNAGKATITHKMIVYDGSNDENWGYSGNGYYITKPSDSAQTSATNLGYSNQAVNTTASSTQDGTFRIGAVSFLIRLGTGNEDIPTFRAWIEENPLQVVYPLATPMVVDIDPIIISTFIGQNTLNALRYSLNVLCVDV